MYEMFKITAETFAKNCVSIMKVNKTDNKSVYMDKNDWYSKSKTFMAWLIKKLKTNLRLII